MGWYECMWLSVSVFFFKQKTAYEMRISDWSSDVCSSDLTFSRFSRLLIGCSSVVHDVRAGDRAVRDDDPLVAALGHLGDDVPGVDGVLGDADHGDRKSGVEGTSVSVRVALGGRRIIQKKN